ncbi:MAG: hypothetical protein AB7S26_35865 [Sandaracinaceae bacterium]
MRYLERARCGAARGVTLGVGALTLGACGLIFDLDPQATRDGGSLDASAPPVVRDAQTRTDGARFDAQQIDAASLDASGPDGGWIEASCSEEEHFSVSPVGPGTIDVAAGNGAAAVVLNDADEHATVYHLDARLASAFNYGIGGVIASPRLARSASGFGALVQFASSTVLLDAQTGSGVVLMTSMISTAGLSSEPARTSDALASILFDPLARGAQLVLADFSHSAPLLTITLGALDTTDVRDVRIEEHPTLPGAYVIMAVTSTTIGFITVDATGGTSVDPPQTLLAPGAIASDPDLSMTVSGTRMAFTVSVMNGMSLFPEARIVEGPTRAVPLWDPATAGSAAAVASLPDAAVFGVARIGRGGELRFELRSWIDGAVLADIPIATATEGETLDIAAEPGQTSFLLARKPRASGNGAASVVRVRCALSRP